MSNVLDIEELVNMSTMISTNLTNTEIWRNFTWKKLQNCAEKDRMYNSWEQNKSTRYAPHTTCKVGLGTLRLCAFTQFLCVDCVATANVIFRRFKRISNTEKNLKQSQFNFMSWQPNNRWNNVLEVMLAPETFVTKTTKINIIFVQWQNPCFCL